MKQGFCSLFLFFVRDFWELKRRDMMEAVAFHTPHACKVIDVSIMYTVKYTQKLSIPEK